MQSQSIFHSRFCAFFEVYDVQYTPDDKPQFLIYHDDEWIFADAEDCVPASQIQDRWRYEE